jgi:GDP/UDP-N,N'-diacetylbacillosamine 2-epimerase (hydrolysing)
MGESGDAIYVVGAPGLDGLIDAPRPSRLSLCASVGFDAARPVGLLVFHPVLEEASDAAAQIREILAAAADMFGNSSSGIIEAASFGTPVVNVGSRQSLRERNINVTDVPVETGAIRTALNIAVAGGRFLPKNIYGDGRSSLRIAELLATVALVPALLAKRNAY